MILVLFFLTSPLVIYSFYGIRLSRLFLVSSLLWNIIFKNNNNAEELTYSKNFLRKNFLYLSLYTSYLFLITTIYIIFDKSNTEYVNNIIQDLGPRLEILLILLVGIYTKWNQLILIVRAFILGWILNVIQSFNIAFYTFNLVSNPVIGSFFVDADKYPNLTISGDRTFGYSTSITGDAIKSFFRSFGLIGEPSIFGIYAALMFVIIYQIPDKYLPFFVHKIPKFLRTLFALVPCILSMSKTSIILLILFAIIKFTLPLIKIFSTYKVSLRNISFILLFLIIILASIILNNSFISAIFTRLTADSGHLDLLFYSINSSLESNFFKLIFGDGLGIHPSSHRFFITQFREGGIFGLIFSVSLITLFINNVLKKIKLIKFSKENIFNQSFSDTSAIVSVLLIFGFVIYDPSCQPILWTTFVIANLLFFEQEINFLRSKSNS